jgi:hypothetical protein
MVASNAFAAAVSKVLTNAKSGLKAKVHQSAIKKNNS